MEFELVVDLRPALRMLDEIATRAEDADWMLDALTEDARAHIQEAFDTEGFGQWPANDPAWAAAKSRGRVLQNTGMLLDSLVDDRHPLGVRQVQGDSVTVTTRHPAAAHLKRGARGMPRRDPVPAAPSSTRRKMADRLLVGLVDGTRG